METVQLTPSQVPKLKVTELKDILKQRNLPISGKKKDLIKQVVDLVKRVEPLQIQKEKPIADTMVSTRHKDFMDFVEHEFQDLALKPIDLTKDPCSDTTFRTDVLKLLDHQQILKEYMKLHNHVGNDDAGSRGLLVMHSLGSGKSLSAVAMAENSRLYGQDQLRKVIVLTPASLRDDPWIKELSKFHPEYKSGALLSRIGYYILHYNSNQVVGQLNNMATKGNPFDNSVVIVDEVHNIANTLAGRNSENANQVYNWMMLAENAKFIFLSGTPFSNTPFELAFLFNVLRGEEIFDVRSEKAEDQFLDHFFRDGKMINKQLFKRRIQGLVSYYQGLDERVFAKKKVHKVLVPMSNLQQKHQTEIYRLEDNLRKGVKKGELGRSRADVDSQIKTMHRAKALKVKGSLRSALAIISDSLGKQESTNFWVFSRSNSNITYPVDILEKYGRNNFDKVLDFDKFKKDKQSLSDIDFSRENLKNLSPKMEKMLSIVNRSKGLGLIYSNFEGAYGITALEEVLKQNKFDRFKANSSDISSLEPKQRYTVWSGSTSPEERRHILKIYNHPKNENGEYIKLILITAAGREGISLRGVRHIHIMEPWWNMGRIKQVVGRGVRICSHAHLPKEEQEVDIYNYFSVATNKSTRGMELMDILVSKSALKKQKQENEMLEEMKKAAFDCELNKEQTNLKNCINFKGSKDAILFSKNIEHDLENFLDEERLNPLSFKGKKYLIKGNQVYEYASKDKLDSGFVPERLGIAILNDKEEVESIQISLEHQFEELTFKGKKFLFHKDDVYQFMTREDLRRGMVPVKLGKVVREDNEIVKII